MTVEKLTARDKRTILAAVLISVACIVYTTLNFQAAFPEASIDLRLSKPEITALGEEFLASQGLSSQGFRQLTLFDSDEMARTYLERELGVTEANRLMQGEVAVWHWRARWFRPPDEEEMLVYLSPAGSVTGFVHVVPEAEAGARLEMDAARRLAENFLRSRTGASQRLVEEQLQERPARHDFVFTWEQEGVRAREATYRRTVVVQGDKIGRYSEYLHVPEQWRRDFATLRSSNELYSQAASVLYLLLGVAAVVVLIQSLRRRQVHWKPLALIAGSVGLLMTLSEWNSIPFAIDSMPTSSPYSQSLMRALLLGLGAGVGVFFYVILAAAPGEPLYRELLPGRLSLAQLPTRAVLRTREFFLATVTGYGFAAFHIAFVVAFYLIGRRFGVWSPQDINYSDFLSTRLPWIYPLTISLLAATSEEFWFRLLAIPLLKRYLRSTWLAVLIPAFLWGFLHANYPQQPGYIRGVEVGLIGVAAGFLMLRFGILATLIWHYTVDAVLIGMFLFRAESWYFRISGWLVGGAVLLPLVVSLVLYQRRGGFLAPEAPAEAPVPAAPLEAAPVAQPLLPRWPVKWLYVAAVAAGLIGALVPAATRFGDFVRVRVSRPAAEAVALGELARRVPEPAAWRRVADFQAGLSTEEFEYLRRIAGSSAANEAVREHTQKGLWVVRFFQPLRKEEWRIYVDQRGAVASVVHLLDEKAPGARLSADEARRVAEAVVPLARYRLVDSSSEKRDRRTDHRFVWEDTGFRVGEARARISINVQGDEASGFRPFLKLPDEWLREFSKPRLAALVMPAVLGAVGLLLLALLIRRIGERSPANPHRYHWRAYGTLGAAAAGLSLLGSLNQWPLLMAGYDTATPLGSHLSGVALDRVTALVVAGFVVFLAALTADVFLQWAAGNRAPVRPWVARAVALFALLWGLGRAAGGITAAIPGPRLALPLWSLPEPAALSPAVSALTDGLIQTILVLCVMIVLASAAARFLGPRARMAAALVAAAAYASGQALTIPQFLVYFAIAAAGAAVVLAAVRICGVDLRTFAVALFWLLISGPASSLIRQPAPVFFWNGIALAVFAAAAGVFVLRVGKLQNRKV